MTSLSRLSVLCCAAVGLLAGGCTEPSGDPSQAQKSYGRPVDATDAIPAPAVAAEATLYTGPPVTVDGRVASVMPDGCTLYLMTGDGPPLRVDTTRPDEGTCAWQVPPETDGFAVAAGTLRATGDTLRLSANGVRVTPVRTSHPDP
ncbi:hypothetical protein [Salinibacter altiplanensis]|uniref:hypothetical protein n=1 Tax=Salinibacter altiplanensis TaxID=1803181 RepID=UPI000C9F7733|nr:hypothetical protein [Salinibacter altiplanensis]